MVNTEIRLIIFFAAKMEKLYTVNKKKTGADSGSEHELLIAKFRLKLKKAGKTPFCGDLVPTVHLSLEHSPLHNLGAFAACLRPL